MTRAFYGPLILTGMHRSGTSLLARVMERLGLFMGHHKERNHEATLFLQINEWLLRQAGASWDNPRDIRALTENPELLELARQHITQVLRTNQLIDYLGLRRFLRYRRLDAVDFPWAFKDPRCVLTLAAWLQVFPSARVLYIYRNGVDVANSLKVRSDAHFRRSWENRHRGLTLRYRLEPRPRIPGQLSMSLRCLSLDGAFTLWKEYCEEAERALAMLPAERRLILKFEEFVRSPVEHLPRLCRIAGLEYRPHFDDVVRDMMQHDKIDKYRRSDQLSAYYRRAALDPQMISLGYGLA